MLASFYTPWDEYARLPAPVIEAHLARCRVLGLAYDTKPAAVAAAAVVATEAVQDRIAAEVKRSMDDVPGMVAYMAPGYTPPTGDPFAVLDDPWGLRHIGYWGGRGGSKTTVVAHKLVKLVERSKRPLLLSAGREHMASIRESSHAAMKKAVAAVGTPSDWTLGEYQLQHKNGSRVIFIGMQNDPGSLDGIDIFWGDEAAFFSQGSLDRLIPTVRDAGSLCIWTWNPAETTAPIETLLRSEEPPELSRVIGIQAHDNAYLYRTALHMELRNSYRKAKRSGKMEGYNHTWRGAFTGTTDATVFGDVTRSYIDFNQLPCRGAGQHVHNLGGFDFGYGGPDDSAAVNCWLILPEALPDFEPESGMQPIFYIAHAKQKPRVPNHELHQLAEAVDPMAQVTFLCDSGMPLMIDALVASGVNAMPAVKGPGSLMTGFRKLQSCQIIVSPACDDAKVSDQFTGLRYEVEKKTGAVKKPLKVIDKDAHAVAACRYALSEIELSTLANGGVVRL